MAFLTVFGVNIALYKAVVKLNLKKKRKNFGRVIFEIVPTGQGRWNM